VKPKTSLGRRKITPTNLAKKGYSRGQVSDKIKILSILGRLRNHDPIKEINRLS
jgi:hypothetical protein